MKIRNILSIASVVTATVGLSLLAAPAGSAAPTQTGFGARQQLVAPTGNVAAWTVDNLRKSTDTIPTPVKGELWESTATVEAVRGDVTPIISDLNARSADGQTYRVLFNVPTPQGINPEAIHQGARSTGKVYFDVVGQAPDSVVYNDARQDHLIWK